MSENPFAAATVLVIDDNPTNLTLLSDSLTGFGFTVLLKKDGEKALDLIQRKPPDIILLDVLMPGIDGFEVCRRLKASDASKQIPVIFMTALSDTVDKVKGFELGAVDYITKPFEQEEVLARIKTHLTIQHLQRRLRANNADLQAALQRERKLLEHERKMLDDLRLNLSITLPHELRTPLNVILGHADILLDPRNLADPRQIAEYAGAIRKGGTRLHRLIENALLYANLKLLRYATAGRERWEQHSPCIEKDDIARLIRQKAEQVHRLDDVRFKLSPVSLRCSPENFEKILSELLDNAFKFSEPGTPVSISSVVNGSLCMLTIDDHGIGIEPEHVEMIGAYMQFNREIHEQQGSGLGLIISYLLAQLEGGMLSVTSKIGQGTSVSLVLACDLHAHNQSSLPEDAPENRDDGNRPDSIADTEQSMQGDDEPINAPPSDLLDGLDELAVQGHVQGILDALEFLENGTEKYPAFTAALRHLAQTFQMRQIRQFLQRCRHP